MPTYQYECGACGHMFEELQSMTDPKLKKCPKCKKDKLHRLIGTGGGIIFKGSGFYETDYKKKDAPSQPADCGTSSCACKEPDTDTGLKDESKAGSKSESKYSQKKKTKAKT